MYVNGKLDTSDSGAAAALEDIKSSIDSAATTEQTALNNIKNSLDTNSSAEVTGLIAISKAISSLQFYYTAGIYIDISADHVISCTLLAGNNIEISDNTINCTLSYSSGNNISISDNTINCTLLDYFNRGIELIEGQDLNDITTFGVYYSPNAATTESLLNIPCSRLHANSRLEVFPSSGVAGNGTYLIQKLYLNSVGCTYEFYRIKSTTWSSWHLCNGNDFTKIFNDTTTATYFKIASYTISSNSNTDYDMTFLITNTYSTNKQSGILKCHLRRNSATVRTAFCSWLIVSTGIGLNDWFVAYDETNKTFDLWAIVNTQYHGYNITLLESSNRHATVDSANNIKMYFLGQDNIDTDFTSHTYDVIATSDIMSLQTNS